MALDKRLVRAIIAICGIGFVVIISQCSLLQVVATLIFVLAAKANTNEFLTMLEINQWLFVALVTCGSFLLVTAAVGVAAAYSKNHCMAFIVS